MLFAIALSNQRPCPEKEMPCAQWLLSGEEVSQMLFKKSLFLFVPMLSKWVARLFGRRSSGSLELHVRSAHSHEL
eukprot:2148780-Amphidinium_carterae.1